MLAKHNPQQSYLRRMTEEFDDFCNPGVLCYEQLGRGIHAVIVSIVIMRVHSQLKQHRAILGTKIYHVLKSRHNR